MGMFEYPRGQVEIYAMARMRIKQFERPENRRASYAAYLLEQHFKHVDRLIDLNVR